MLGARARLDELNEGRPETWTDKVCSNPERSQTRSGTPKPGQARPCQMCVSGTDITVTVRLQARGLPL
eukprot:7931069-Alexandrium_andersonii.AAC.1